MTTDSDPVTDRSTPRASVGPRPRAGTAYRAHRRLPRTRSRPSVVATASTSGPHAAVGNRPRRPSPSPGVQPTSPSRLAAVAGASRRGRRPLRRRGRSVVRRQLVRGRPVGTPRRVDRPAAASAASTSASSELARPHCTPPARALHRATPRRDRARSPSTSRPHLGRHHLELELIMTAPRRRTTDPSDAGSTLATATRVSTETPLMGTARPRGAAGRRSAAGRARGRRQLEALEAMLVAVPTRRRAQPARRRQRSPDRSCRTRPRCCSSAPCGRGSAPAVCFDPTVLAAVRAAGYDRSFDDLPQISILDAVAPPPGCDGIEVDTRLDLVRLPAGVGIDPGGIGKGLAADLVATAAVDLGADGAMVSLGGDLRVAGTPPPEGWEIELDHHVVAPAPDQPARRRRRHLVDAAAPVDHRPTVRRTT